MVVGDITGALLEWNAGVTGARERVMQAAYQELRVAAHRIAHYHPLNTLPPTAVVHEAHVRLAAREEPNWRNRSHFLSVAAKTIRSVYIDHARAKAASKRGGGRILRTLRDTFSRSPRTSGGAETLLALHTALTRLEQLQPRRARVVELRFFAGLTIDETAAALDVTHATVERDWQVARAWLHRRLSS